MAEKFSYLYVHDGFADWEPMYLTAELNSGEHFADRGSTLPVRTVGLEPGTVTSWGGLRVGVDLTVDQLTPSDAAVLILPGGDSWLEPRHDPVVAKAREFLDAGVVVAAICMATVALGNAGLLDTVPHTSNHAGAIAQNSSTYRGEARYVDKPAVSSANLVTASGMAPLEFARETLAALGVVDPQVLDAWYRLNTERSRDAFFELARLMGWTPEPTPDSDLMRDA